MTSSYFSNHSLEKLQPLWINRSNQSDSNLEIKLVDNNCAKHVEEQTFLSNVNNNLPDLLEEAKLRKKNQDITMLSQQICFKLENTYKDCDNKSNTDDQSDVDLKLISNRDMLQDVLGFSKDMEGVISQLQTQVVNLITGYKVLKSKNMLLEHKLKTLKKENVCKSCKKKKFKDKPGKKVEHFTRIEDSARDKQLEINLPSPPRLDPELLTKISKMLSQSENFLKPIEQSLTTLQMKMQKYQIDNEFETNQSSLTSDYENESDNSFSSTNFYSI